MTLTEATKQKLSLPFAALMLMAIAILTITLTTTPAAAQTPAGAISDLTLSSPNASQLVASWSAPTDEPSDYRVRWAPSDEDYLSFSAENTDERGSAYPQAPTLTVDNLPAETEYKVQARARYNTGEYADSPWSGPWTDEQTITISSPPVETPDPTPEPTPEPTPIPTEDTPSDLVTDLALASEAGGQLVITWTQPSDEPTDYRVVWAPSDEEYLSFSEDNTDRRGNAYPAGADTSLTVTGLPGGIDYKVMMRARYHDAQNDVHTSGPWTDETTQLIRNSPPEAPTGLNAAEVSDSSVSLKWTAPTSSRITGYRVFRGLTAKKQAVLVNNTGSNDTEYLDSDVEADTEYHYSVQTINDAGVSDSSTTIAVTTSDTQGVGPRQNPTNNEPKFPDTGTDGADPITLTVNENSVAGTLVGTVTATDADDDTLKYGTTGGDNLLFARTFDFNTTNGEVTLKTGAKLDHEVRDSYAINITVGDGIDSADLTEVEFSIDDTVAVTITVTDVAETETVELSYPAPWADVILIAGLDGDDVTALTWSWERFHERHQRLGHTRRHGC